MRWTRIPGLLAWSRLTHEIKKDEHLPHSNTIISEPSGFKTKVCIAKCVCVVSKLASAGKERWVRTPGVAKPARRSGWLRYDVALSCRVIQKWWGARDEAATPNTLTITISPPVALLAMSRRSSLSMSVCCQQCPLTTIPVWPKVWVAARSLCLCF